RGMTLPSTEVRLGLFALAAQTIISGASYAVIGYAARHYPPLAVLGIRASLAALLLASVSIALRREGPILPPRGERLTIVLVGIAGIPINQGCLVYGLALTEVSHAALLYALTPVWVALLARLTLGERLGLLGISGVALGLLGTGLVLQARGLSVGEAIGRGPLVGDLWIMAGVA